jgi:hypothetical protein
MLEDAETVFYRRHRHLCALYRIARCLLRSCAQRCHPATPAVSVGDCFEAQRMAVLVVDGAVLTCSFGATPSALAASPASPAGGTSAGAATIMDFAPFANIRPFGICSSPTNPAVIALLSPQPCIPATASPWVPGSPAVTIGGQPALDSACTCNCLWAGVISVISPGQQAAQV